MLTECGGQRRRPDASGCGKNGRLNCPRGICVSVKKRSAAWRPVGVACDAVDVIVHPRIIDRLVHDKRHHRLDLRLQGIAQHFHGGVRCAVIEHVVIEEVFVDPVRDHELELGARVKAPEDLGTLGASAEDAEPERVVAAVPAEALPCTLGVPCHHPVASGRRALPLECVVVAGPIVVLDVDAEEEIVGDVDGVEVSERCVVVRQGRSRAERAERCVACVEESAVPIHHFADVAHIEFVGRAIVLLEHLLPQPFRGVEDAFERAVDIQRGERTDGRIPAHVAIHPARDFIDDEGIADVVLSGANTQLVVSVHIISRNDIRVAQFAGSVVVAPFDVEGSLLRVIEAPWGFGDEVIPDQRARVRA